jgi:hypothetical protein
MISMSSAARRSSPKIAFGARDEAVAVGSRCHAARGPVEQGDAQGAFQLGDGGRDRRLRQVEQPSGLAEAPLLGDREQDAELPQLQMPRKPLLQVVYPHTDPPKLVRDNRMVIGIAADGDRRLQRG